MTAQPCPLCEQVVHQKDCPRRNTRTAPPFDNAQQDAREGDDHDRIWLEPKVAEYGSEGRLWCQDRVWDDGVEYVRADQLAAKDAEIERLTEDNRRDRLRLNGYLIEANTLIRQLTDALRKVKSAIENENGLNSQSIVCTVWVSEIETAVDFIDEAIAAAETMMGEKK